MPIQNVDRDNTRSELFFKNFFPDKQIDPWLYDTCFFLEVHQIRPQEAVEETVELSRIIGITHGAYGPSSTTVNWSDNWLGWFWRLGSGKGESHRHNPFGNLYEAIAKQNTPDSFNFYLYRVSISGQSFYFIGEGHHRIMFLKLKGDQFFYFKRVVPATLLSDKAICF